MTLPGRDPSSSLGLAPGGAPSPEVRRALRSHGATPSLLPASQPSAAPGSVPAEFGGVGAAREC